MQMYLSRRRETENLFEVALKTNNDQSIMLLSIKVKGSRAVFRRDDLFI